MSGTNVIGTSPLAGKSALVTGGSRGIGAALVRRPANDGAAVAFAIKADSAEPEAVRKAVSQTVEEFGGLDILVNNAGILTLGVIDDYTLADFDRMVAVNVRAVFVAVQAAIPHLREGGRIISTGSVNADRAGFPGAAVYSNDEGGPGRTNTRSRA